MSRPVIFLDPTVLMKSESLLAFNQNDCAEFDKDHCNAFQNLIKRMQNVAIILILPADQMDKSLEQIQAAYCGLGLGDRIVGQISTSLVDAPLPACEISESAFSIALAVRDWLSANRRTVSSFVIIQRCDSPIYYTRSIPLGKCEGLIEEQVSKIDTILTHRPFSEQEYFEACTDINDFTIKNIS